jgi:hypothetical protein
VSVRRKESESPVAAVRDLERMDREAQPWNVNARRRRTAQMLRDLYLLRTEPACATRLVVESRFTTASLIAPASRLKVRSLGKS